MRALVNQPDIRWRLYRPRHRLFHNPLGFMPLVNLALLIMLFLILHASFVRHPTLAVQLPNSAFRHGTPYGMMTVTLTQEGQVFFDDERRTLDNLAAAFSAAVRNRKAEAVIIEADLRVPYGVIVRVMNMASVAGFRQINLAIRPSFGEETAP